MFVEFFFICSYLEKTRWKMSSKHSYGDKCYYILVKVHGHFGNEIEEELHMTPLHY